MKKTGKYIFTTIIVALFIIGYFTIDNLLFDGVRTRSINENDFQANYFAKESVENQTTIVLIGGGPWGDYWGQYFAKNNMVGLSLPYIGKANLPDLPEEIELEYFEKAIKWLIQQPEVDPNRVVVMGASRNAELSLVLASTLPNLIHGVVAYAPSCVSWSNTVLPFNSDELKASWKYKGVDIPYVPMDKIKAGESKKIEFLDYWEKGLAKVNDVEKATIEVVRIQGPILLISGNDDKVWPASKMADRIQKKLDPSGFQYPFINLKYDDAGHQISGNPDDKTYNPFGTVFIDGKEYEYEFGGTAEGNFKAKQEARKELMTFLNSLNYE